MSKKKPKVIKVPSAKDVLKEAARLREMKPHVHRYSAFNDDHHAGIDACIQVLEQRMTVDQCYDAFPTASEASDDEEDNDAPLPVPSSVQEAAISAARWMVGDEELSPANSYKDLDQRKKK